MKTINYETIINTLAEKIDRQNDEMLIMQYRIEGLKNQIEAAQNAERGEE